MMKEMKNGVFTYNNESYNFEFKTSLSAYDKQVFVKTVVGNLVDDAGYDVVIKDLIFDFVIIEAMILTLLFLLNIFWKKPML